MKQLGRFLRLERARKDSEHDVPQSSSRFATLEEACDTAPTPQRPTTGLERFAPQPAAELELERQDNEEPFVRCPHCGADSSRHAAACRQCDARLDSDEVRAFNVRLWADMTAARESEARELKQWEQERCAAASATDAAPVAELGAREGARRALETPSAWTSRSWLSRASAEGTGLARFLIGLAVGIPVLLLLSRHGKAALGAAVLATLVGLLSFSKRRTR